MSYFLAFCLALCWGTAFLASKNIVDVLPPYWGAFFRVLAGLLFFIIFFGVRRTKLTCPTRELWRPWTISSMLILLPFVALSWGIQHTVPTVAGIFNGTVPIWSFIAGAILLKGVDRFTWRRAAGVLIGLAGLLIIMRPQWQTALTVPAGKMALLGYLALLFMALCYGLGNVLTKKIMVDNTQLNWEANTFHQYLFATIILCGVSLLTEPTPTLAVFDTKLLLSILSAGVFSSAVAFLLMIALIKRWGATRMASVTYFSPIIAMGTDMLFRGRMPHSAELLGMILIFISLWLIQKKVENK
ncbi:MAG: DMT family transporter [Elusimicrobiaceae bacterium]|nr:DMT family transporter [Elusimicrobiaceae bacterium]